MFPELLTSVPEYTGDENALRFVLRAKSLALNKFAIQTAEPDLPIIKWSENANLADFYRHEIELRRSLSYPPFGVLILITYLKNAATQKMIEETFKAYQPTFFEGMGESKEERVFFRLSNGAWPDRNFRALCLSLPQTCAIEIMPERLFS
jgi:primosomal protein N'